LLQTLNVSTNYLEVAEAKNLSKCPVSDQDLISKLEYLLPANNLLSLVMIFMIYNPEHLEGYCNCFMSDFLSSEHQ
jgi:hypothetical protein